MISAVRGWLPPLCLLALVAVVWAVPGGSECPDSAVDDSPAIARVNQECVYWFQFGTYLRDLLLELGPTEQESAAGESALEEYFKDRNRLVSEAGPENAAFATLAMDLAQYQQAAPRGPMPPLDEVMAQIGQARERISNLKLLVQLHELAKASDFAAFRSLIESPPVRQIFSVQGEEHLALLFQQAGEADFSRAIEGLAIHTAMLESVGDDRYWTEIYVEHARRLLAIDALRSTMVGDGSDWFGVLDFREMTWSGTVITLTDAAPNTLRVENVRSYTREILALERGLLEQEPKPFEDSPDSSPNPDPTPSP